MLIAPARTFDTVTERTRGRGLLLVRQVPIQVERQPALAAGRRPGGQRTRREPSRRTELSSLGLQRREPLRLPRRSERWLRLRRQRGLPGVQPAVRLRAGELGRRLPATPGEIARRSTDDLRSPDISLDPGGRGPGHLRRLIRRPRPAGPPTTRRHADTLQELALPDRALGGPSLRRRPTTATAPTTAGSWPRSSTAPTASSSGAAAADDPILGSAPAGRVPRCRPSPRTPMSEPEGAQRRAARRRRHLHRASTGPTSTPARRRSRSSGSGGRHRHDRVHRPVRDQQPLLRTPDARVGQRTEQAAYDAAIVGRAGRAGDAGRHGGDLNVYPRPGRPVRARPDPLFPSDQLAPLYDAGLHQPLGRPGWPRRLRLPTRTCSRDRPRPSTRRSSRRR